MFRILFYIGFMLLFILMVNKIVSSQRTETKNRFNHWSSTPGQVVETGFRKSGDYANVKFNINSKIYIEEFNVRNPIIGNCYTIYYDSTDHAGPELNESEQRCLVNPDNSNFKIFDFEMDEDTTPMGWHVISYKYRINQKTYSGNRYIKHKYFKKVNSDSLEVCVNPEQPQASYLFWPDEPILMCIKENGLLLKY